MKLRPTNTGTIVILGYCLLVVLAITGFVTIYLKVIESGRQSNYSSILRKELIDLNNTLTTMYQAEGTANLLAYADNEYLKYEYDSLSYRMLDQIDSLRAIATDPSITLSLDSLSILLLEKRNNTLEMFPIIKQIDKDIIYEISKRTIITRNDVDKLNTLLVNITNKKDDTVRVASEKKSLLQRIQNVFKPGSTDTITHITTGSDSQINEIVSPLMTDTIIQFFKEIDKNTQRKNARIVQQMIEYQHELYINKEQTGFHINKIMDTLKEQEYQTNLGFLNEKNESLKRSASLVAIIGFAALIVAVFFMSWTLQSLNKAQRLQRSIEKAKIQADKLLLSREQLIYTITHDIKAPLSSVIGFLDLMSDDTLSQKQQYYIHNMHTSASHILNLVRSLLDFSSLEKEQFKIATVAFSPASLICKVHESFLPLAQRKKLSFELKSTLSESKMFLSDPYYILQIVNNLLSNAIKFTPENGSISLISSIDDKNIFKISVQDTGPGISVENQTKIFEEFFRLDKTKNETEGTGLGLAISKKLANLLGGTIEVESQEGTGSVFSLVITLTPVTEEDGIQPDNTKYISSGQILFVDDDRVQLNLFSELMQREGWSCICCARAYEALDLLQKKSFDIIFTDICIPEMDGLNLIKKIRESDFPQAATVPVIAFSADYQKPEAEFIAAGFNGFLPKPFKAKHLLEIIEKHTSLTRKTVETYTEKDEHGWKKIMDFAADDKDAAKKIIDSFIEETNKDKTQLKTALQKKDKEKIKQTSHKMLSLMRMISAQEIISILTDFGKGDISNEKKVTLFRLLEETLKEAEITRKEISMN